MNTSNAQSPLRHSSPPAVSVIMAFRNPGPYFEIALQSVFAQSFAYWELLLMDDGSTDGSLEFACEINDPRVRVFSDGLSRGLSPRLNQLVDLSCGTYIARMDADDIMHPERLEQQYKALSNSAYNTVIGSAVYGIDADSEVLGIHRSRVVQLFGFSASGSFIHPTVAASAEWFRKFRYSENPAYHRSEDAELWIRSSAESVFRNLTSPLLFYRESVALSIDKYSGSTLGGVVLGTKLASASKVQAFRFVTVKLFKLWTMCAAEIFGLAPYLSHRHFAKISPAQTAAAKNIIAQIRNTPLPRTALTNVAVRQSVVEAQWPTPSKVSA